MLNTQKIVTFLQNIKAPSEYLTGYFFGKEALAERVCTTCTHVGRPTRQLAGRAAIERSLWATIVVLAVIYFGNLLILRFTQFFPFLWIHKLSSLSGKLFVVISLAYTIIRLSIHSNVCPKCGSSTVIPLDTPKAQEILAASKRTAP